MAAIGSIPATRPRVHTHRDLALLAASIATLAIYLWVAWVVLPVDVVWSPDAGAKLLQLQSLRVTDGRLDHEITYPGRALDPDLRFAQRSWGARLLTVRDGKLYFQRLPVFPLLSAPFFTALGFHGLYLLPAVCGVLCMVFAIGWLPRAQRRPAMWVLAALGSPVLIYATLFWEHTPAACLALAAGWLALHTAGSSRWTVWQKMAGWMAVGALLAAGTYLRLEIAIFAGALLLACGLKAPHGGLGAILAGTCFAMAMLPYRPLHAALFAGKPVPSNATHILQPFAYLDEVGWRALQDLLVGPAQDGALNTGWLGTLFTVAALIVAALGLSVASAPAVRRLQLAALSVFVVCSALFLFNSTFYHSGHGLLFTTPWAVLGVARAAEMYQEGGWRGRILVLTVLLGLCGYAVAMVGLRGTSPQGGLEWGARFAIVFYPLLALMAASDLRGERRAPWSRLLVTALVFLGIGFQLRGLYTIRYDKTFNAALYERLVALPEEHVVSDIWWLPLNAGPVYAQKEFFVTATTEELAEWVDLAAAHGADHFAFVTTETTYVGKALPSLPWFQSMILTSEQLGAFVVYRLAVGDP